MSVGISVIIPVYNVEKYVKLCIDSVIKQIEPQDEVIIVDDGSTDNSGNIVNDLINKIDNVKYHKIENKGLSNARNYGMLQSTKPYVCFVDSDDVLKKDYVKEIKNILSENKVDVLMFGYDTFPNGKSNIPEFKSNAVITPDDLFLENYKINKNNYFCFSWRFVFKNEFLKTNNLKFDINAKVGEDYLFNAAALLSAKNIWVMDKALYMYRTDNANSIMRTKYKEHLVDTLQYQYHEKLKLIDKFNLNNKNGWVLDFAYYYVNEFKGMLIRNVVNSPNKNKVKMIREVLNLDLVTDNYKTIGHEYWKNSKRAAIVHFLCKHKCAFVINILARKGYFG